MRTLRLVIALVAALAVVAALGAVGCGSSSDTTSTPPATTSPATSSGIIGLMTIEGGAAPGNPQPMSGVQIEVRGGGEAGQIVETAESSADGTFTVNLPPGRYTVVPVALGDEAVLPASVTVHPGKWAHVSVGFSVR
jgi:hypothetical protein